MLNHRRIRQLYICMLCLTALLTFLPQRASAASRIDTERSVSLTLRCQKNKAVPGVEFSLYRVADVSETVRYTLTGDFADYPVALDEQDSAADWQALAQTLAAYASRDKLTPLDSGKTGSDGILRFPTDDQKKMLPGLYLVVGKSYTFEGNTYTQLPFLVSLPNLDKETDQWVYDETATPKYTREDDGGDGDSTVNRKVLKVWKDDEDQEQRPREVVVQLLRNGEVYQTVTLNEANNWRHLWTELDADDDWQVVEETVPDGYTVSINQDGITFVVTNTYHPDKPENPDHPDKPDEPDNPDKPENPDNPDGPDTPDSSQPPDNSKPGEPSLPQTGALWWPVPALAGSGMLLFLLGWIRAQKRGREDER